MSESIGAIYPTQIPGLADNADIQAAFRLYHYGSAGYSTANSNTASLVNPSVAYSLNDLQEQITTIGSPDVTASNSVTLTNKTLKSPQEIITVSAIAATGTINFDVVTQSILYYTTNASANFTLNFRGNSSTTLNSFMSTGNSLTLVFMNTNGATAYYPTAITIDGNAVTPKIQGGTAISSGNVSSIDAYSITIIKTASATFTVLEAQTKFA